MMRERMIDGARTAAAQFGIREASALETILGVLGAGVGGSLARGALNALSPKVLPALEAAGGAPINMARRALQPSPAGVLARHLSSASPAPLPVKPDITRLL